MKTPPIGDHTPADYMLPQEGFVEVLKRPVRRLGYPLYNAINHARLSRLYGAADFQPDLWLWGQRGNDYQRHRRRVAELLPMRGKDILVAGCGTAGDLETWVDLKPRMVQGVDWFSYEKAWQLWRRRFQEMAPGVDVRFEQGNLERTRFGTAAFDVVSSDAVFEHLKNLPIVLEEFHRILKPGGILYSTFGPLWYGWGGDHVSGYDGIQSGYNHLLLSGQAYRDYLEGMGPHSHSEHDGRTWIEHDLFSRLTARQYLECLEKAGFRRRFVSAMIEPRAVACLRDPGTADALLKDHDRLDLLVTGMTIIYER
jgi:SAM-dependent methyltransferase